MTLTLDGVYHTLWSMNPFVSRKQFLILIFTVLFFSTCSAVNVAKLWVIGVDLDPSDPRAYPLEILNYHEIVNDVIGGRHVAITWSPLSFSNALIMTDSLLAPRTLGSSGKVFQNNQVLFDRATYTLWTQIGSFALQGPMIGSQLPRGQSMLTYWDTWKKLHPNTKVLNRPAPSTKNYLVNPYSSYQSSDRLLFDSCFEDHRTESPYKYKPAKELTLVVFTEKGNAHLFPVSESSTVQNIEDLDDEYFTLVWDTTNQFTSAYNRVINNTKLDFYYAGTSSTGVGNVHLPLLRDKLTGSVWNASGTCISGQLRGLQLKRLTSFDSYWATATSFFPMAQIWMDNTTLQYFPTSCPRPTGDTKCSVPCSSIFSGGPAIDSIKSIDAPTFMTPIQFESIVRIPEKTITAYSVILSGFFAIAVAVRSYYWYIAWINTPAESQQPLTQDGSDSHANNAGGGTNGSAGGSRANISGQRKHSSIQDNKSIGLSLSLKEDDEEEPALPPEKPAAASSASNSDKRTLQQDISNSNHHPSLQESTSASTRKRRRNRKHGRSASLVDDSTGESIAAAGSHGAYPSNNSVQMDVLHPPLTARAASSYHHSSSSQSRFASLAIPRLSVQPWNPQQFNSNTSIGKSTLLSDNDMSPASSGNNLHRNKSESDLTSLQLSTNTDDSNATTPENTATLNTIMGLPSSSSSSQKSRQFLNEPKPLLHRPLSHLTSSTSGSSNPDTPNASSSRKGHPRLTSGFEHALAHHADYTTSIDSSDIDNYQISLTSVASDSDEDVPSSIISAKALARIKGKSGKKSSQPKATELFAPISESPEPEQDQESNNKKYHVELDF